MMNDATAVIPANLDAAIRYAQAGYPVLRVYGVRKDGSCRCHKGHACSTPGKHPADKKGLRGATINLAKIRTWFRKRPDHNVGIATGPASNIVVVDIDPRNDGNDSLTRLMSLIPNGFAEQHRPAIQKTGGGGAHYIFRHPGGKVRNRTGAMPGVDIKANGGLIVVAPSVHASGGSYEWEGERGLPDFQPGGLPDEWLFLIEREEHTLQSVQSIQSVESVQEVPRESRYSLNFGPYGPSVSEQEIDVIIEQTLPTHPGKRHEQLWQLTRKLKVIFGPDPIPFEDAIVQIVDRWYQRAKERNLVSGFHCVEDCYERVFDSWSQVRYASDEDVLPSVTKIAHRKGDHPACSLLRRPSPFRRLLVGLCAELADPVNGKFYLGQDAAAKAIGSVLERDYDGSYSYDSFRAMLKAEIIEMVKKGDRRPGGRATEWRFLWKSSPVSPDEGTGLADN